MDYNEDVGLRPTPWEELRHSFKCLVLGLVLGLVLAGCAVVSCAPGGPKFSGHVPAMAFENAHKLDPVAIAAGGAAPPATTPPAPPPTAKLPQRPASPQGPCNQKNPFGSAGCITPRMLIFIYEAAQAGFHMPSNCWRPWAENDHWEHPKGRACDWMFATPENSDADGDERRYGDAFANWVIANAKRLGVQYIIWFKRSWNTVRGTWARYTKDGSPYQRHTNHVHVSVVA